MKVYIGPYKSWFGPHQLAELLCFWVRKVKHKDHLGHEYMDKPDWVFKLGEWFAYGKWRGIDDVYPDNSNLFKERDDKETLLYRFLQWVESKRKRTIKVKIDRYDTWSMDHTLALIILPMLKQLKETKHGSPIVDLEDVPENLRSTNTENYDAQQTFKFYSQHDLKEGTNDIHARWDWVLNEMIWSFEQMTRDGESEFYKNEVWDVEGHTKYDDRINNGTRLFGKYFRGLWD